jgi:hypothetical protein
MQGIKERWQIMRIDSEYIGSEKLVCYAPVIRANISSRKLKLLICTQNIMLSRKKENPYNKCMHYFREWYMYKSIITPITISSIFIFQKQDIINRPILGGWQPDFNSWVRVKHLKMRDFYIYLT